MSADCVFCRIVAGDVPAKVVNSDEASLAFLDLSPWHTGHTLVIPRRHVADVTSDPTALAEIAPAVTKVAALLKARLGADGVNVLTSAGAVAGQEVFHLHVHVIPRYAEAAGLANLLARDADEDLDAVLARVTASRPGGPDVVHKGT